jgi:hypothetical protein
MLIRELTDVAVLVSRHAAPIGSPTLVDGDTFTEVPEKKLPTRPNALVAVWVRAPGPHAVNPAPIASAAAAAAATKKEADATAAAAPVMSQPWHPHP